MVFVADHNEDIIDFFERQNQLIQRGEDLKNRLEEAKARAQKTGDIRPVREVERRLAELKREKQAFYGNS